MGHARRAPHRLADRAPLVGGPQLAEAAGFVERLANERHDFLQIVFDYAG